MPVNHLPHTPLHPALHSLLICHLKWRNKWNRGKQLLKWERINCQTIPLSHCEPLLGLTHLSPAQKVRWVQEMSGKQAERDRKSSLRPDCPGGSGVALPSSLFIVHGTIEGGRWEGAPTEASPLTLFYRRSDLDLQPDETTHCSVPKVILSQFFFSFKIVTRFAIL